MTYILIKILHGLFHLLPKSNGLMGLVWVAVGQLLVGALYLQTLKLVIQQPSESDAGMIDLYSKLYFGFHSHSLLANMD